MISVEMAHTAVGRTTIECCLRWSATKCAGSDTAGMTSAESWTSARPASIAADRPQCVNFGNAARFSEMVIATSLSGIQPRAPHHHTIDWRYYIDAAKLISSVRPGKRRVAKTPLCSSVDDYTTAAAEICLSWCHRRRSTIHRLTDWLADR